MELLDLIKQDTTLKKRGSYYISKCPIHKENKESFICSESGFKCFSCGSKGKSPVTYIMLSRNLDKESAITYLKNNDNSEIVQKRKYIEKKDPDVQYLMPCLHNKPTFEHYSHGFPSQIWEFKNYEGQLIGYTCRFDLEDGKVVLPYNYISVNECLPEWKWKGFKKPSVLYNAHLLKICPEYQTIVVEGEKTADAIMNNMKNVVAVTWVGGSNAINTVDFTHLHGRNIVLWPDNDLDQKDNKGILKPYLHQAGNKAMIDIGNLLLRKCKIKWVKNPITFKHKFDAADRQWRQGEMKNFIEQNSISFFDLK